jgi:hypothetical protein
MATVKTPQLSSKKDISLSSIITFFRENLKNLLIFAILGLLGSGLYILFEHSTYKGKLLLAPATFLGKSIISDIDIQTLNIKFNLHSFYSEKSINSCNIESTMDSLNNKSFNITLDKKNGFITVNSSNSNKEKVEQCLNNIATDLIGEQDKMLLKIINNIQKKIDTNKAILESIQKSKETYYFSLPYKNKSNKEYQFADYTAILMKLMDKLTFINSEIIESEMHLKEGNSAYINMVYISKIKQISNPKLFLILGIIFGASFGVLISLFKKIN